MGLRCCKLPDNQIIDQTLQNETRTVNLIMLPTQALGDPDTAPFLLRKQAQDTRIIRVEVLLRNELQEWLGQYNMSELVFVV